MIFDVIVQLILLLEFFHALKLHIIALLPFWLCLGLFCVLLCPLYSAITIGLFGRFLGETGVICISLIMTVLPSIVMLFMTYVCFLYSGCGFEFMCGSWIDAWVGFEWSFIFDALSCIFGFPISVTSMCITIYSIGYMAHDPHIIRFLSYIFLFTFFMLFLVFSGNSVQLFIGWEGVGIVSYLLVNFWFTRAEANRSALKAVFFNRIGDLGFVLGVILTVHLFNPANFGVIFGILNSSSPGLIEIDNWFYLLNLISFSFLCGAVGKSAQIGLHAWLPDAMEGPTPVSALLHSATMVTAGIFVLLRLTPIFSKCIVIMQMIAIIGSLTAIFGATVAIFQFDIKKIIAYSTCSQLGFMVAAYGIFDSTGSLFHVTTHAFFKALLFLAAGSVIHALADEQDIRKMGGLFYFMPFTAICMLIGFFGLTGFPFFSGFHSKEHVLFLSLHGSNFESMFVFSSLFFPSICTALYSVRVMFLVFYSKYRGFRKQLYDLYEANILMAIPMGFLSVLSIVLGYFIEDSFIGIANHYWYSIFPVTSTDVLSMIGKEEVGVYFRIIMFSLGTFVMFRYIIVVNNIYSFHILSDGRVIGLLLKNVFDFFIEKWWFGVIYYKITNLYFYISYRVLIISLDRCLFERIGPLGLKKLFYTITTYFIYFQNNRLTTFFLSFLIALVAIFIVYSVLIFDFLSICLILAGFVVIELLLCAYGTRP